MIGSRILGLEVVVNSNHISSGHKTKKKYKIHQSLGYQANIDCFFQLKNASLVFGLPLTVIIL